MSMSPNFKLNSVLMEGDVMHPPEPSEIGGMFSMRGFADGDVVEMRVEIKPGPLLKSCSQYLVTGKGVRVVGKLIQTYKDDWVPNETRLLAEHVEFHPGN